MSEFNSLRKSLGFNLDKVAETLGVSRRTASRWSSGAKQASKPALHCLRLLKESKPLDEPRRK